MRDYIISTDLAGPYSDITVIVERVGNVFRIVGGITAEELADSYLDVMTFNRFKLLEIHVRDYARLVKRQVLDEIRRKFECLREGHDCFSVHDSQGDGIYTENFSYLECRNCGEQLPYDGRDDYDEPFFDDMEESPL